MAGVQNALLIARTAEGMQGTAGRWPSNRKITGIITQSAVQGDNKHSALLSLINVTFVGFVGQGSNGLWALEACGKCKTFQGGSTSFTQGLQASREPWTLD